MAQMFICTNANYMGSSIYSLQKSSKIHSIWSFDSANRRYRDDAWAELWAVVHFVKSFINMLQATDIFLLSI